jgi:hypothetical protein
MYSVNIFRRFLQLCGYAAMFWEHVATQVMITQATSTSGDYLARTPRICLAKEEEKGRKHVERSWQLLARMRNVDDIISVACMYEPKPSSTG